MSKTRTVLKVTDPGFHFTVVKTEGTAHNPYAIYKHYPTFEKGYPTWHKELQARYADLRSCLFFLAANCND